MVEIPEGREPDAIFPVHGHLVKLTGHRCEVLGVEVVIDDDFTDDERTRILRSLHASLAVVHPRLRGAIRRIVIPDGHDPSHQAGAASANPATGQICLWSNRHKLGFPAMLPETRPLLLEHECAHLLDPTSGPPNTEEWKRAIELDGADDDRGRFVQRDVECYPEHQQLLEDWANAVSDLLEADRSSEAWFRRRFPHRSAIIDRVLDVGR